MKKLMMILCVGGLLSVSCTQISPPHVTRGQAGAGIGAAGGAILGQAIGRDTEGTLIGTALGGVIGYIVGNEMDKADRANLHYICEEGKTGVPFSWQNQSGMQRNAVVKETFYRQRDASPCRKIIVSDQNTRDEIVLCRNSRGQWYVPQ